MTTPAFYDALTPFYHLIYPDWPASIARQAQALDSIIRSAGGSRLRTILDAACGIGTQSLGLAALGYEVTASDLSPAAVKRTRTEAQQRNLSIQTSVADMRLAYDHHRRRFDVVLACDNSVPHLLSDSDILSAFQQFYACTAPAGLCLVSMRDYAAMDMGKPAQLQPYGIRDIDSTRFVLFQIWDPSPPLYDTTLYLIEHRTGAEPVVHSARTTYYAVPISRVVQLMEQAGFSAVSRLDDAFFQPVIVGHKLP